jgi:S1-C subfamily serine protease
MVLVMACGSTGSPPPASFESRVATPTGNIREVSFTLEPAPQFGLVLDKEMRVIDVEEGGAADEAGVWVGDVLTALNGDPLSSLDSLAEVGAAFRAVGERALLPEAAPASVTVRRGGSEETIEIVPAASPARPGQPTPTAVPADQQYI